MTTTENTTTFKKQFEFGKGKTTDPSEVEYRGVKAIRFHVQLYKESDRTLLVSPLDIDLPK